MAQARDIINDALATAMHTMCTTIATALGSAPGSFAFAWDMLLKMLLLADCQSIACLGKHHVNVNLWHAIRTHFQYDYAPGNKFWRKWTNPMKLGVRTKGPYTIECVHVNGTLTFILHDGVTEWIKICRSVILFQIFSLSSVETIHKTNCIRGLLSFNVMVYFLLLITWWKE